MKQAEKEATQFVPEEKTPSEDRLVMLCDGVFAIAMTLLVLDIGINISQNNLPEKQFIENVDGALGSLVQPIISYLVTFFIIAVYWRNHRKLMQIVQRLDNAFISLTFFFLAFIAFFPVTSKLLGNYADDRIVVSIYTLGLSGCGFSACALWVYATWKHRLVSPDFPQSVINARTYTLLLIPLIYCASLLLLFVVPQYQPYLICFSWVLIGLIERAIWRSYKRWLEKPVQKLLYRKHEKKERAQDNAASPETPREHTQPAVVQSPGQGVTGSDRVSPG